MPLSKGDTLGSYTLLEPLGSGGMGEVYRALDPRLGREVAIKVLPDHLADKPQARSRFEREVRAVAALSHPNLLVLYDVGTERGVLFAVTELLEGETLATRLDRGPLPWRRAIELGAEIADGLAAAHAKGVIHRDLKPANLFLTTDGRIKILDFGLALVRRQQPVLVAADGQPVSETRSFEGTVVGSQGYMSPEQASGETVDHRADLFALGCVLYELVTGTKPFLRPTFAASLAALLGPDPPAMSTLVPGAPAALDAVVARALRKDPVERIASATELAAALRALASTPSGIAARPRPLPAASGWERLLRSARRAITRSFGMRRGEGRIRALAVLPFTTRGNPTEGEYLSDGIAESILRTLSRRPHLQVIAWSTAARYRHSRLPPLEIGRELAVDAVLTGQVLEHAGRLVVTVELVEVERGELVWGERYDRRFIDVFEVQEEIAQQIARRLLAEVEGRAEPERRRAIDPEAYKLYLRGRYFWNQRSRRGLEKSREYFEQAIARDPGYALAHVGLADAHAVLPFWGLAAPAQAFPIAKAAARRALELEPELAEAHASLAYACFYYDWQWPVADAAFRKALELNPGYATARHGYGVSNALRGNFTTAFDQLREARELDPLSLIITSDLGLVHWLAGEPEETVRLCRAVLELETDYAPALLYLGLALVARGELEEAVASLERAVAASGQSSPVQAALGFALARSGRTMAARGLLAELAARSARSYVSHYPLAVLHTALGETDAAFARLAQAREERSETFVWLRVDPRLEPLRPDPRFAALLAALDAPATSSR